MKEILNFDYCKINYLYWLYENSIHMHWFRGIFIILIIHKFHLYLQSFDIKIFKCLLKPQFHYIDIK